MCYQWGVTGTYFEKKELSSIDYNSISKIVEHFKPNKPFYGLFGGEPLLYKSIWETIDIMKCAGSVVYMDTNGTLIGSNARKIVDSGIDRLWISLDGPEEINDIQRGKNVYLKVVNGIDRLFEEKTISNVKCPEIGVSYLVTPLNYLYVEELFCNKLDLSKLDYVSIEFQNFMTKNELLDYQKLMLNNFNIQSLFTSKGIVREVSDFSNMDFKALSDQISRVKTKCEEKGIVLLTSPVNTEKENIEHYFKGEWSKFRNRKCSCQLPWLYAEITASGNVSTCHTFYDYTLGNIYEDELDQIFINKNAVAIRKQLKQDKLLPICVACSRYHANINYKF
jgi:radical SAM protein with 4Fe4S-binding SPASM domain